MFNLNKKIRLSLTFGQVIIIGLVIAAVIGIIKRFDFSLLDKSGNEIQLIKATSNLNEQIDLYQKLIKRVGPVEAQEELYKSGLPFTGQTHLLNHAVGDYLYEKYGSDGLVKCREYFLASCNHGFVLRAIGDGGMANVSKVMEACDKAGPSVFAQCVHAVGHGFLAYSGYKNLLVALEMCDELTSSNPKIPAFSCYDGVFMENIWAVHENGLPSLDRWVRENDLFYPCSDERIDKKYQLGCWSNQPALAYQLLKGDIKSVAMDLCLKVKDLDNQRMCFDGLARQIHPLTQGSADAVFKMCGLMPEAWIDHCIIVNANSYFGVGDREVPFAICNMMNGKSKEECYQSLIGFIKYYGKDTNKLCAKIADPSWRGKCLN